MRIFTGLGRVNCNRKNSADTLDAWRGRGQVHFGPSPGKGVGDSGLGRSQGLRIARIKQQVRKDRMAKGHL